MQVIIELLKTIKYLHLLVEESKLTIQQSKNPASRAPVKGVLSSVAKFEKGFVRAVSGIYRHLEVTDLLPGQIMCKQPHTWNQFLAISAIL